MRPPRASYVTMSARPGFGPSYSRFMLDWLPFQEPIVAKIVAAAAALLVLTIVVWFWQRRREARWRHAAGRNCNAPMTNQQQQARNQRTGSAGNRDRFDRRNRRLPGRAR